METLGNIVSLKPDESVSVKEVWNLFDIDVEFDVSKEEELDKMVEKYIK